MSGWNLRKGNLKNMAPAEEQLWQMLNFVFSSGSRKRNSYKFGLIKSILDNLLNCKEMADGELFLSYKDLFAKFTENYWNLVVKYNLRQMRPDGKSEISAIERILTAVVDSEEHRFKAELEFIDLSDEERDSIISKVSKECKRNVFGALYEDTEGLLYGFDLKGEGIFLSAKVYDFLLKHKTEVERLNYYSWAKFLESVNSEAATQRLIDKLELSTPQRSNLSVYREVLYREFEQETCFYCGKKLLTSSMHVDHFLPWSFVREDKIWNFVLACPECNIKKKDKMPNEDYLIRLGERNKKLKRIDNAMIEKEFTGYSYDFLRRMWMYYSYTGAKLFKE